MSKLEERLKNIITTKDDLSLALLLHEKSALELNITLDNTAGTYSTLAYAAFHEYSFCMEMLLDAGVNTDKRSQFDWSPLICACNTGNLHSVNLLLHYGADPNDVDHDSWSPLIASAVLGDFEMVSALLNLQANVHYKTTHGDNALMFACRSDRPNIKVIELLIECGSDVHMQNSSGETPFMYLQTLSLLPDILVTH